MLRSIGAQTALALTLSFVLAPAAHAQSSGQSGGQSGGASESDAAATTPHGPAIFEPSFFLPYNPLNAADMVGRVPGFEINDGDDRRGFGATAGNVLINGERPSSKATISEQLRRIPAGAVLRVELLSGSASGIDVHGQSRLVNVILRPTSETGSPVTWVAGVRYLQYSNRIGYTLQVSKAIRLAENMELALDLQAPNLRGRTIAHESVEDSAGALTRYREQYTQPNFNGLQGAASLKWRISPADSLNINALYNPSDNSIGLGNVEHEPTGAIISSTYGRTDYPAQWRGELGADWEHSFGDGLSLKLIGLVTSSTSDQSTTLSTYLPAGLSNVRRQFTGSTNGERLGRATLSWKVNDAHSLEFGAEGAFNYRDSELSISNQASGGPIIPVALSVANTRVEEIRGEVSATDIWQLSPDLTLEAGFNFEASRITQTGDESKQREFTYAKPSLAITWLPDPGSTLRASVRRDVSQLDFAEFATSVSAIDNITLAGNPDLSPEQAWKARLEWDKRFGGRAAVTLGLFHDEVEDVRDLVVRDIDTGPGVLLADAVGNLGKGTRTGVDVRGTLPLDFLGLAGADLRVNALYQDTRVKDPLTGETRSFSSGDNSNPGPRSGGSSGGPPPLNVGNRDWGYVVSLRQEVPELKSFWSFSIAHNAPRHEFKLLEAITTDRPVQRMDLSWETTAITGLTLRLSVGNFLSPAEERVRTFYAPDRSSGAIARTESRRNKGGSDGTRSFTIQLSGKF